MKHVDYCIASSNILTFFVVSDPKIYLLRRRKSLWLDFRMFTYGKHQPIAVRLSQSRDAPECSGIRCI